MNPAGIYEQLGLDDIPWPEITATLRRDWAVRVLDAWAKEHVRDVVAPECVNNVDAMLWTTGLDPYGFTGHASPDAARHAAAEAVFPTLPEDVRAELGECP